MSRSITAGPGISAAAGRPSKSWTAASTRPRPATKTGRREVGRAARPGETGDLFALPEPEPPPSPSAPSPSAPSGGTWIDRLFATEQFAAQRRRAARAALSDERIRIILTALDARGGTLTRAALGTILGVPAFRLDGILSALRRILNVDGYDVLAVDDASESVTLNRGLLLVQFDVGGNRT